MRRNLPRFDPPVHAQCLAAYVIHQRENMVAAVHGAYASNATVEMCPPFIFSNGSFQMK
jgi:hypothetical protein